MGEKKETSHTAYESDQMWSFTEKCFKTAIRNMFTELHKSMIKEVKEAMTMLNQIESINKKIVTIIWKNKMEILKLRSSIIEIKNLTRGAQQ